MRKMNFTAGPATLPEEVIEAAQAALWDIGVGAGILEISHRTPLFDEIMHETQAEFRRIANVHEDYAILFMQGGATLQFCELPMYLTRPGDHIDCIHTGFWTRNAMRDAVHFTRVHYAYDGASSGFEHIPTEDEIVYSVSPRYVYYCANNSFMGTEWQHPPRHAPAPLVADMSSNIFSRPIDVNAHGAIFASTQKNLGIAGCCVLIIRKDWLDMAEHPSMFDYRRQAEARSMLNTPPVFAIFMLRQMLAWIARHGGLEGMLERNRKKAAIVRQAIDETEGFFRHVGEPQSRSLMNIAFRSPSQALDDLFVVEAEKAHMFGLKGHRETGGLRASLFNAMKTEHCQSLADFIREFTRKFG